MSKVVNAPPMTVSQTARESAEVTTPARDATAGSNAGSAAHTFEGRVSQETGTH